MMGQSSGTSSSPTGAFLSSQPALLAPQLTGKKPPLQRPLAEQAQKLLLPTQMLSNTVSHPFSQVPLSGSTSWHVSDHCLGTRTGLSQGQECPEKLMWAPTAHIGSLQS